MKRLNAVIADAKLRASLERRFWRKVRMGGAKECWLWQAISKHKFGYGAIFGGHRIGALYSHQVAWALTNGPIPNGACILHTCDNPACCNPGHLYPGDDAQNNADMYARGRGRVGMKHSAETRQRIREGRAQSPPKNTERSRKGRSDALKERWTDPEWRARFSLLTSGPNNPRYGKKPPEHQIEAVRRGHRKHKGYRHTEETKQRMRDAYARRTAAKNENIPDGS